MKRKGVYPYDYMDSFSKFNDNELPKRKEFYNLLNDNNISEDEYNHAKQVWDTFGIKKYGRVS